VGNGKDNVLKNACKSSAPRIVMVINAKTYLVYEEKVE
jgi:hypothetical protein